MSTQIDDTGVPRFTGKPHTPSWEPHTVRDRVSAGKRIAAVSRASLHTDLANALERNKRLAARVRQLEKRLSQALGETAWADSGLGAPADIDQLQQRITMLKQNLADIQGQLDERADELEAARAANRELTRALNQRA